MEKDLVNLKRNLRRSLIATAIIIMIIVSACAAYALVYINSNKIVNGVSVSGVNIGGLTKEEAAIKLQSKAKQRLNQQIILSVDDTRYFGTASSFGASIKWQESLENAFALGRDVDFLKRIRAVLFTNIPEKQLQLPVVLNEKIIKSTIKKAAAKINRPHENAKLIKSNGVLTSISEKNGIKLDQDAAYSQIADSMAKGENLIKLQAQIDEPDVRVEDLNKINTQLAVFTTSFNRGKVARTHNLTIAAEAINGTVIKPGDVFSYNKEVGPRVLARGFQEAIIFVNGKQEPGIGGGICQVSSTLYNSALLSGMKIVERHHHSRTVTYVTSGRDATVSYGVIDFKFKNINKNPICIFSEVVGSNLKVEIYGASEDKKNIQVYAALSGRTPFGVQTIVDKSLAPGRRRVEDKGSSGVSSVVYRKTTTENGSNITEVISKDRYAPQNKIILVGAVKKAAITQQAANPKLSSQSSGSNISPSN